MHIFKLSLFIYIFSSILYASTYSDTFSNNTITQYNITNSWTKGGIGDFTYDNTNKRVHVQTGDNVALIFSHTLPASTEGSFSIDFFPTTYYPNGGVITLKLIQDATTYYQIENTDGYGSKALSKYVNGVKVDSKNFSNEYTQGINYTITIDFTPTSVTVQAFGQDITINTDISPITVTSFSFETTQQDAFYDNIIYNTNQNSTNTPPIADAGTDRTIQVNETISISGSGSDSDGTIISYAWKKGNILLANTATFDYIPNIPGTDTLTLIVTDNNGSTSIDTMDVTVTELPGQAIEVIIDNLDSEFSTIGTWASSIANDRYAQSSFYSRTENSRATWKPNLQQAGLYQVYVWYSGSIYGNRNTQAQYTVNYNGGSQTVTINQNQGSGNWVLLGTYTFNAGTSGNVTLTHHLNGSGNVSIADAVKFTPSLNNIVISTPLSNSIQASNLLKISTMVSPLTSGWGIKFILDQNTPSAMTLIDYTSPYTALFHNISKNEHTIDTYIIDASNTIQTGTENHASVHHIARGDIYVAFGDSITNGYGDTINSDNISQDGRNNNRGYPPILNDKLTILKGYPHSIINEGIPAETIQQALRRLPNLLTKYSNANTYLILSGTNNTSAFSSELLESGKGLNIGDVGYIGTYKYYMQQIINLLNNANKELAIAKIPIVLGEFSSLGNYILPITGSEFRNVRTKDFNIVIDELRDIPNNNITIISPNLYTYFLNHYNTEYFDNLHPNGLGYKSIADLWKDVLIQ